MIGAGFNLISASIVSLDGVELEKIALGYELLVNFNALMVLIVHEPRAKKKTHNPGDSLINKHEVIFCFVLFCLLLYSLYF